MASHPEVPAQWSQSVGFSRRAVVATSDTALYANLTLKKGVVTA